MFARMRSVWRSLWHRARFESDLDDEMRFHVEARADDLVRSGLSRNEAVRRARIEFGCAEAYQDRVRESRRVNWFEDLAQDLRFGARMLRKSPGFTAVAVLTLALGIGANTAIFTLIDAVMLRMLPVQKPQELLQLGRYDPRYAGETSPDFSNPLWEQVRDQQNVFSGVFAWANDRFDLARGGTVQPADGSFVSGDFFTTLGPRPAAGRLIAGSDDYRGCPPVAALSYGFWQGHYGGASGAVGSTLSLNNHALKIIGVAPPGFYGMDVGRESEVFLPICTGEILFGTGSLEARSLWWLNVAGRIKPGISRAQLVALLQVLSPRIFTAAVPQYWPADQQRSFVKEKLAATSAATGTSILRQQFEQPLQVLMAIVGLVLLIACANLASLMLTRGFAREKEIAVRRALGASRWRLIKQLLTECMLISLMGAIVGFLFARWGTVLLIRSISIHNFYALGNIPVLLNLSLDARVLGFTAAVDIVTAALFGILPSLRSTGVSLTSALKGSRTIEFDGPARFRSPRLIVASQVAFSLVLLVAAGLLLRSFAKLATLDVGFDRRNVLIVYTNLWMANVPRDQYPATLDQIENRLGNLPGVVSVSRSTVTPTEGSKVLHVVHTEWSKAATDSDALAWCNNVSPGYFETLRMQLLSGRNFNASDTDTPPLVAIVNETLAHRFFPGLNPIGRTFWIDGVAEQPGPPIEVVGLIRDAKYESLREGIHPTAFFPATQAHDLMVADAFELRTGIPPVALISSVQTVVAGVNKEIPLEFHTLAEQVSDSMVQERLLALLSGFFGALALLLAMIGLYGTVSYLVAQRQREFGIRIALGAEAGSILRLVMRNVISVLAVGLIAGVGISLAATRALQAILFGLGPRDAVSVVAATAVLSVVSLGAGYIPARRAMRVDPMVALRHE
jgi:putative ABC transport system permease protein